MGRRRRGRRGAPTRKSRRRRRRFWALRTLGFGATAVGSGWSATFKKIRAHLRIGRPVKIGFVDEHRGVWPVRVIRKVLGLCASGYYARWARPESPRAAANRALLDDIRLIYAQSSGTYGSPRVQAVLRGHGRRVGRTRIERIMRHAGIRGLAALPRRTRTTDSRHG